MICKYFFIERKTEIADAISFPDKAWWSDCLNPQCGDDNTGDNDEQGSQNHGRVFHNKFLTSLWFVGDEYAPLLHMPSGLKYRWCSRWK